MDKGYVIPHTTTPTQQHHPYPPLIYQRGISPQRRDTTAVTETGNAGGSKQHQGLLLQYVHGPQEGRRSETGYQPETPEQICEIRAFQNGGTAHCQGPHSGARLNGKNRSEECFLHGPYSSTAPTPSSQWGQRHSGSGVSHSTCAHHPECSPKS